MSSPYAQILSEMNQVLGKSFEHAIDRITFDKTKYDQKKALEFMTELGISVTSFDYGDKEVVAVLRKSDEFDAAAPSHAVTICDGVSARFAKIKVAPTSEARKSDFKVTKDEKGELDWELDFPIAKLAEDQQIVYGIVYEPDVVDAQGDSAGAEDIMKAAHRFMQNSMRIGYMHQNDMEKRAKIIESYIAPVSFQMGSQYVRKGAWVMALKIDDPAVWSEVKAGKITGLSMGGRARSAQKQ